MANRCDICGKGAQTGYKISHSHRHSKRRWLPNVQRMRVVREGREMRARVCTSCLKAGKVQRPA
jgi:large subunit ribosomal protein L28